jgi:hypothetical protein
VPSASWASALCTNYLTFGPNRYSSDQDWLENAEVMAELQPQSGLPSMISTYVPVVPVLSSVRSTSVSSFHIAAQPYSLFSMHQSIFSYNLARPYPFRWFTPATLIGAVVATAVFSFLNVAATGYEMITVESSNPNKTTAATNLFSKWPSFMTGNTQPSCESKILGVSNAYYTNNTAFSYKLESIRQNASDNGLQFFGDLPYYNNALKDCTIPTIEIFFQGLDRTALQIARQMWGAELKAKIICTVDIPEGSRMIELSTTYDFNSEVNRFPGQDEKSKPSLWWGESLLAWYYIKLTRDIYMATQTAAEANPPQKTYKGYIEFAPPKWPISRAEDFTSSTFFEESMPGCFFVSFSDDGIEREVYFCDRKEGKKPFDRTELWATAATITKIFHSTILVDLGQSNPNILVDKNLLQFFSKNITAIDAQQKGKDPTWGWGNNLKVEFLVTLAMEPYTMAKASIWKLAAQPSFVSVTYLCQVPQLKSRSSLVFSVLIADIVFLQVLWKVFILVVDFFMYRRYSDMGSCQGCQGAQMHSRDEFELLRPDSAAPDLMDRPKPGAVYSPL